MKFFFSWLSTPYYFNNSIKFKLKISIYFGLFVFLFLYIFEPFDIHSLKELILRYTLSIGIFTIFGVFIMFYLPALLFKKYFNEDNWTIGKNILYIFIGIILIGSVLWYVEHLYLNDYGVKGLSYFTFLTDTFFVTTLPLIIFILLNEKSVREKRNKRAEEINSYKEEKLHRKKIVEEIIIYSDNKKEKLVFNVSDLVYITSQGNYASFFFIKNNDLKEKILRVTLTKIDEIFIDYSKIVRCHKSYIVNINYIKEISGNARGYLLKSDAIPTDIPVSRNFSKQSLQSLLR